MEIIMRGRRDGSPALVQGDQKVTTRFTDYFYRTERIRSPCFLFRRLPSAQGRVFVQEQIWTAPPSFIVFR